LTASLFADDDARVVMLFVRLRSLLFEMCLDHPVALCKTCSRTYTPAQLGTEIGNGCYLCRDCGADLRESVVAHARTCPNLTPQKPLARMAPVFDSKIPPTASDRFLAQRRNAAAR
jgi:predicted amidophosphoribosyltransferase